jgi:MFS family permease
MRKEKFHFVICTFFLFFSPHPPFPHPFSSPHFRFCKWAQYDLVCEKDIYPTLGLVALNVGGPIGVYVFGVLNDRYGRRFSYFSCLATLLLGSFITAFSTDFGMWAFSRMIVGLTIPAVYQIPFIIGESNPI